MSLPTTFQYYSQELISSILLFFSLLTYSSYDRRSLSIPLYILIFGVVFSLLVKLILYGIGLFLVFDILVSCAVFFDIFFLGKIIWRREVIGFGDLFIFLTVSLLSNWYFLFFLMIAGSITGVFIYLISKRKVFPLAGLLLLALLEYFIMLGVFLIFYRDIGLKLLSWLVR